MPYCSVNPQKWVSLLKLRLKQLIDRFKHCNFLRPPPWHSKPSPLTTQMTPSFATPQHPPQHLLIPFQKRGTVFNSLHILWNLRESVTEQLIITRYIHVWPGINMDVYRWASSYIQCQHAKFSVIKLPHTLLLASFHIWYSSCGSGRTTSTITRFHLCSNMHWQIQLMA